MADRKGAEAASSRQSHAIPAASFPTHNSPRTWFLTQALSPLAIRLIRQLLAHGDYVAACLPPREIENDDRSAEFRELINECKSSRRDREGWKDRIRGIRCDGREMGQCGAAVAEAVSVFGRVDILLCCQSEAAVGTVEELSVDEATRNLVRDQFETIFFSQVNFIKAALPQLRAQHTGHILILSSTGGHIATPWMTIYSAATWALEGFCDSLAYEIAPFNVKVTIVQPNKEIQDLTNKIIFAPQLPWYESGINPAPSIRDMLSNLLNSNPDTALPGGGFAGDLSFASSDDLRQETPQQPRRDSDLDMDRDYDENMETQQAQQQAQHQYRSHQHQQQRQRQRQQPVSGGDIIYRYTKLPPAALDRLVMETVHALAAIGGHENPPSRHIVGFEGAIAVKEKLRTVTEELEDFVEASTAVDINESESPYAGAQALEGSIDWEEPAGRS